MELALRSLFLIFFTLVVGCVGCAGLMGGAGSTPVEPTQPTVNAAIARSLQAAVALYRGKYVVCSGERIDSNHILTAYHCAAAISITDEALETSEIVCGMLGTTFEQCVGESKVLNHTVYYSTYNDWVGKNNPAKRLGSWVKLDRRHDLALMLTDYSPQPSVLVNSQFPSIGEQVYSIGNPAGMTFSYTGGWVSALKRTSVFLPPVTWLQVDITLLGGGSGGGLYNMKGELIGVASRSDDGGVQSFFVPPDTIGKFLQVTD